MSNELRASLNIYEILEDYDKKVEEIPVILDDIKGQVTSLENKCKTMGTYGGTVFKNSFEYNDVRDLLKALKKSSWRYVYNALHISHIAPKTHIKHFENLMENPPEFTAESIKSVFKEYVTNPRAMSLRAFAEVFNSLDSFYKSHSNIKIGVKGLPKKVIIGYCGEYISNSGYSRVADVVNTLIRYRGKYDKCVNEGSIKEIIDQGETYHGLSFRSFKNGNVHVIFDKDALNDINKALAEYYGDVLPDAYEHSETKAASKEVSKDLQFYRTPPAAVRLLLNDIYFNGYQKVLEPSCGDGAILDGIMTKMKGGNCHLEIIGVEFDKGRCEQARTKGYTAHNANFLMWETKDRFDHIIMNPPFYGKHYAKHIDKAYELLEEGGCITAILPITAKLNHGILDKKYRHCRWGNMPIGSFSESGTNINTVIAKIFK